MRSGHGPLRLRTSSEHSIDEYGQVPKGKRFRGRSSSVRPTKAALAAPRFKEGRNGDFCVQFPLVALKVRQVQKQARRLQALCKLLGCLFFGPVQQAKAIELWRAVMAGSGFRPSFQFGLGISSGSR